MAQKRAERQIVIAARPRACFDAAVDYESLPDWQRSVRSCRVLSRDRDGRGRRVAFEVGQGRPATYTLDFRYESPHLIAWSFAGREVRDVDGELVFEDRGDGTTLATYALRLDPGAQLPSEIARALSEQAMELTMEDLKRRAERGRHA